MEKDDNSKQTAKRKNEETNLKASKKKKKIEKAEM